MWGRGPGGYITITTTTKLQLQLQLHDNYNYNYNYTALKTAGEIERCREKVTESVRERGRGGEREIQSLNHLSIHKWVRSAIHASQQFTSPIVSYL